MLLQVRQLRAVHVMTTYDIKGSQYTAIVDFIDQVYTTNYPVFVPFHKRPFW